MLQQAITLATHPVALILLALTLAALWHRRLRSTLPLCLLWLVWLGHLVTTEIVNDPYFLATRQGCIGHADLYVFTTLALLPLLILTTVWHRRRALRD